VLLRIRDRLRQSDLPGDMFCFEITETAAIADLAAACAFIDELKALRCRFALDDIGAGMSSYAYIRQLAVDYLKIDGHFVHHLPDPLCRAIIRSVVEIASVVGMKTVAEWVEEESALTTLAELGVDYAQGYGIERPQPFA